MKYKYSGPLSGVSLNTGDLEKPKYKDFILTPGQVYDLPENNEYIKTLIKLGHLTQIDEPDGKKTPKKEIQNAR